ncbi:MAG: hypothetical protein WA655_10490 [Candidatus Korobacteraceae bacterium]
MDFMFHGQRIRETTGTASKTRACRIEQKRHNDLAEGTAGIRRQDPPRLFLVAAEEWVEAKKLAWSTGMSRIARDGLAHLLPQLGKKLLLETLKFRAEQFPGRLSEHYVFPTERVGAAGDRFDAKVYEADPTQPIGSIKEAWKAAKRRSRRQCPNCETGILADREKPDAGYICVDCELKIDELLAGAVGVRFHDLRHTAVSRMIAARIPLPIIAKIVGWSRRHPGEDERALRSFRLGRVAQRRRVDQRPWIRNRSTGVPAIFTAVERTPRREPP